RTSQSSLRLGSIEHLPAGVRYPHAGNLHRPVACDHALGRHAGEPGVDQLDQSVTLEAVCEQARRSAAMGRCGEQFERALALGVAARVLCHSRHALDVSSAYEIGESSPGTEAPRRLGTRTSAFLGSERWVGRGPSGVTLPAKIPPRDFGTPLSRRPPITATVA